MTSTPINAVAGSQSSGQDSNVTALNTDQLSSQNNINWNKPDNEKSDVAAIEKSASSHPPETMGKTLQKLQPLDASNSGKAAKTGDKAINQKEAEQSSISVKEANSIEIPETDEKLLVSHSRGKVEEQIGNTRPQNRADLIGLAFTHSCEDANSLEVAVESTHFDHAIEQVAAKVEELEKSNCNARVILAWEGLANSDNRKQNHDFNTISHRNFQNRGESESNVKPPTEENFVDCFGQDWGKSLYNKLQKKDLLDKVDVFALGFSGKLDALTMPLFQANADQIPNLENFNNEHNQNDNSSKAISAADQLLFDYNAFDSDSEREASKSTESFMPNTESCMLGSAPPQPYVSAMRILEHNNDPNLHLAHMGIISIDNAHSSLSTIIEEDGLSARTFDNLPKHLYGVQDIKKLADTSWEDKHSPNNNVLFVAAGKDHFLGQVPENMNTSGTNSNREEENDRYNGKCWEVLNHVREVRSITIALPSDDKENLKYRAPGSFTNKHETEIWTSDSNFGADNTSTKEIDILGDKFSVTAHRFGRKVPLADDDMVPLASPVAADTKAAPKPGTTHDDVQNVVLTGDVSKADETHITLE